ncbi:MAG TPA: Panacea domain-containing protein [Planctomycetota bacterium]|nr:Panacea domain-containing protein [Planctomycetota bacterium]
MHFPFELEKAIAATALLISEHKAKQLDRLRIQKLLYLAERESLRLTGRPIVGDKLCAMQHGPVLSHALDLMRGIQHDDKWSKFFSTKGPNLLILTKNPGVDALSQFDVAILKQIAQKYRARSSWNVVELTHEFPEWKRNYVPKSSRAIPLTDILHAVGRSDEEAKEIVADAEYAAAFARQFGAAAA